MTYNDWRKQYYRELLDGAKEKLGGVCAHCGCTEDLEFDHVNPETKLFNISSVLDVSRDSWNEEVEKCQLLCRECHKNKCQEEGSYARGNPQGEQVGTAKLTADQVREIRAIHSRGEMGYRKLAKLFNVTRINIQAIVTYRSWKHI